MNIKILALSGAALAVTLSAGAFAQTSSVPNYGQYESRDENFRIGVLLDNSGIGGPNQTFAFGQNNIEDITDYLDPSQIAAYQGAAYTPLTGVSEVLDLRGAPVLAGYAPNSSALTIRFVSPRDGTTLRDDNGQPCLFTYNNGNRQASFDQFDEEVDDETTPTAHRMMHCLGKAWSRYSPVDPLVGNPYSLQGTMTRSALDFAEGDSLVELGDGANSAGDPWVIGATFSGGSAGRFNMTRIDARINKGWRIFEGNRARLKFDLPFSFTSIKGAKAYSGQAGLGLEVPLIAQRWSIEPRVAYGLTYSGDQGSIGHMVQGTVASRFVLNGVGRGHILIGNMAGYSFTLKTPGDINLNPDVKNWIFRNGLAYEMPLGLRIGQRASSVRASYAFTTYAGDELYNNNFHEFTVSFGLRGREDTAKALRDVVRINFNTIQARGFSTYTAGIGFRF